MVSTRRTFMNTRLKFAAIAGTMTLGLGACADNYAAEGALGGAAAGAATSAVTGGNIGTGAAVGAAVGGAGGSLIRKNGRCYRIDDRGRERRVRC
jgi:hypothetical protein